MIWKIWRIFYDALRRTLPSAKFSYAQSGKEAIAMLNDSTARLPDYIFLDLNMPGMDGKECLRRIKKTAHIQHIPVIITTNSEDPADVEIARALGARHYCTKPDRLSQMELLLCFLITDIPVSKAAISHLIKSF